MLLLLGPTALGAGPKYTFRVEAGVEAGGRHRPGPRTPQFGPEVAIEGAVGALPAMFLLRFEASPWVELANCCGSSHKIGPAIGVDGGSEAVRVSYALGLNVIPPSEKSLVHHGTVRYMFSAKHGGNLGVSHMWRSRDTRVTVASVGYTFQLGNL